MANLWHSLIELIQEVNYPHGRGQLITTKQWLS